MQAYQEFGGLAGRFLLAILALYIVSRRALIRTFQIPGLFVMVFVFYYAATNSLEMTKWGMFFAGVFTVGQLSFWGNYLPRVFPTHLRGTGEGFAANIGGRMIGTSFAFVTTQLVNVVPGATPSARLALAATMVAVFVYTGGLICSFFLPEPKGDALAGLAVRTRYCLMVAPLLAAELEQRAGAEGWPQFRGPGSTGVADDAESSGHLEHDAERQVEDGHSRPWVVVADRVGRSHLRHLGDSRGRDRGAEEGPVLRRRAARADRSNTAGWSTPSTSAPERSSGSARRTAAYRRPRGT